MSGRGHPARVLVWWWGWGARRCEGETGGSHETDRPISAAALPTPPAAMAVADRCHRLTLALLGWRRRVELREVIL